VRILRVTLALAERLLQTPTPAVAEENLPQDSPSLTIATEIEPRLASQRAFDVESWAYFRMMLRLRERQLDRFRFVQRLILTPGITEWRTVQLPGPLFPLYRIIRLSRLAVRLARA
jgi:hypothetical protein